MGWFLWGALSIVMAIASGAIADKKGRSGAGFFLLGLIVWPVALVGALVATEGARGRAKCPSCAEWVREEARVCKHCGRDLPPDLGRDARLAEIAGSYLWVPLVFAALAAGMALLLRALR